MTDIEKLEALAKAATAGPWEAREASRFVLASHGKRQAICDWEDNAPEAKANCLFIAAANPSAILELVKANRQLQSELAAARAGNDAVWNAGRDAALVEVRRQGNTYRSNLATATEERAITQYRFGAAACNYVENSIRALTRPTPTAGDKPNG